jgi:outer membrane protein assembly factor BamB
MLRWFLTACGILFSSIAVLAQPAGAPEAEILSRIGLAGESPRMARRIVAAEKLVVERKWTEAVDEFQRIIREANDDLVPLDSRHLVQAGRLCHIRIAALPGPALQLYRGRVDGQAKRWLEEGTQKRDVELLKRIPEEVFASSFTDRALDLLGDLALERGEFEEAERWWKMLSPSASENALAKDRLVFPDPHVDIARVRAKRILALLFQGEQRDAAVEFNAFRKLHADAKGFLAGQDGNYAEILTKLVSKSGLSAPPVQTESWPTFAGSPSRSFVLPTARGPSTRLPDLRGPSWVVRLALGTRVRRRSAPDDAAEKPVTPFQASRSLAFYPLLVGEQVLVSDARYVRAFDLRDGRPVWQYDLASDGRNVDASLALPADAELGYSLTAADEFVFARLGVQRVTSRNERRNDESSADSFLVCLDLAPKLNGSQRKWIAAPPAPPGVYAVFEGAPLVYQRRVYAAVTRFTGVDVQTSVVCFDAESKTIHWQRDVCATQELRDREFRRQHHLLTLAGSQIVYCSHSGAITALDAMTGKRAWSVRYPSRGARTTDNLPSPRGLAPCLYHARRIFVAPRDFDRILCLDAETGHVLWESLPVEVVHLLGAVSERLIFTAMTPHTLVPQHSIQAMDTSSGVVLRGWCQPADGNGELATFGRGLLAGSYVYWPTSAGLYVLNQETSEPLFFDPGIRGNLAAANGCLIVAGTERLSAYLPEDLSPR